MSRLSELIAEIKARDAECGDQLEQEFQKLAARLPFGLNFERHSPEAVELPLRPIRRGDKVRVLPPRGTLQKGDQRLWEVVRFGRDNGRRVAHLMEALSPKEAKARQARQQPIQRQTVALDDLIVVAEFKDVIYPGLIPTGKVTHADSKPFHTVINGENYHVLKALSYTHGGKVDAIYIDPPYNTGAKDWKYNNDYVGSDDHYRHSKWLAMMERRLLAAKALLNPADSVLIVTIDEKEYLRLGLLLEQVFSEADVQMISSQINPAVVARAGRFGRADEYVFFVMLGKASPQRIALDREWVSARGRTHTGTVRWDLLRRSGEGAARRDSPGCFYPIYVNPKGPSVHSVGEALPDNQSKPENIPGTVAVLPIRKDGSEGRWQWTPGTFRERLAQGRVKISGNKSKGFVVSILKDGEFEKVMTGEFKLTGYGINGALEVESKELSTVMAVPGTQWRISSHDATQYGTRMLAGFIPGRKFPFPKSLYAVEDALRFFVANKPDAVILDFFSGSGTTAHAVMRLNKQDGGNRQCISITNNEVAADEQKALREQGLRPGDKTWEKHGICDYITKPRVAAAITGKTPEGEPIKGDYKFTDEFPMADGFAENAAFFTLSYETPEGVSYHYAFTRIASMLWLRAGGRGRCIDKLPESGWAVADSYGLLWQQDSMEPFVQAVQKAEALRVAYIVTDDDRFFQTMVQDLPKQVEVVRLYESYLTNFAFLNDDERGDKA